MIQQLNSLPDKSLCSTHVFYTPNSSSVAPTPASSSTQFILNPKPKKAAALKSVAAKPRKRQKEHNPVALFSVSTPSTSQNPSTLTIPAFGLQTPETPSHPIPVPIFDGSYAMPDVSCSLLFSADTLPPHPMETLMLSLVTHAVDHVSSELPSPLSPFFSMLKLPDDGLSSHTVNNYSSSNGILNDPTILASLFIHPVNLSQWNTNFSSDDLDAETKQRHCEESSQRTPVDKVQLALDYLASILIRLLGAYP